MLMKILRLTKSICLAAITLFVLSQASFASNAFGDPFSDSSNCDDGAKPVYTLADAGELVVFPRPLVCGTPDIAESLQAKLEMVKTLLANSATAPFWCGTSQITPRNGFGCSNHGATPLLAAVLTSSFWVGVIGLMWWIRRSRVSRSMGLVLVFGLLGLSPPGRLLAAEVTPGVFTNRLAEIASAENAGILTTVREYHKEFDQNHEEVERTVREKLEPALNDAMVNYSPVTMQGLREALHDVGLAVLKEARANIAVCTNMVTGLEQSRGVAMGVRKQSSRARDLWGKEADANRRAFEEAKASAKMEGELLGLLDSAAHVHEWGRTEFDALAKESAKLAVDLGKEREAIEAEKVSWQALEGIAADTAAILRGVSHGRRNIEEVKVVLGNIQKGLGRSREYRAKSKRILDGLTASYDQAKVEPVAVEEDPQQR
jgi:hypothetical protein